MKKEYLTINPLQTKKIGEILAKEILKTKPQKTAFVIGLKGNLGGGKTTFLQGFAKGLGIKEKITSPTFVIMKNYKIISNQSSVINNQLLIINHFYHIDCYRIYKAKEILDLGFQEIISNPKNIVAIEWAERIKKILPKNTIYINFEFIDQNTRKIAIG